MLPPALLTSAMSPHAAGPANRQTWVQRESGGNFTAVTTTVDGQNPA